MRDYIKFGLCTIVFGICTMVFCKRGLAEPEQIGWLYLSLTSISLSIIGFIIGVVDAISGD